MSSRFSSEVKSYMEKAEQAIISAKDFVQKIKLIIVAPHHYR
jgi:hypothetical protein